MNGLLRTAVPNDEAALRRIWSEAFTEDSAEDIELFFSGLFTPDRTVVYETEGRIVSAAHILHSGKLSWSGEPVFITYAVATLREYRSRGIGTAVVKKAFELTKGLSTLHPASALLFNYYKNRCGYRTVSRFKELRGVSAPHYNVSRVSLSEYADLREKFLKGDPHVIHTDNILRFQEALCRNSGGGLLAIYREDEVIACAAAEKYDETAYIKELLFTGYSENCAASAAHFLGCADYIARTPARESFGAVPYVMAKGGFLPDELQCWFGLQLD